MDLPSPPEPNGSEPSTSRDRNPPGLSAGVGLVGAVAALAALIRIPLLGWGLPEVEEEAFPVRKAFEMWGWDRGSLTLDPQTGGWPSLSFYVQLALQQTQYLIGRLTGLYENRLDFFVAHVDLHTLMIPARAVSMVAGVTVVAVGVRLALRLGGAFGALLVGVALSASPLLVEHSIKVTPDILVVLFSALALGRILDVHERGRPGDYAWSAVWIGLGAASKYTPVLLIPCLVAAHVARTWTEKRWRSFVDRRIVLAGLACVLVFLAASPFALLNAAARRDVSAQFEHVVTEGHFGHELRGSGYRFYAVEALPAALGWPGFLLGVAGLVAATLRRRGPWLVVSTSFACWYLGLGALRSPHAHYVLPALLPLALGLTGLVDELDGRLHGRSRRRAVGLALALVVVAPLAFRSARLHRIYSEPSTLALAKDLILHELDGPNVHFACEVGGPALPVDPALEFTGREVFARLDEPDRDRLRSRPFVHQCAIPMYATGEHGADLYYDLRHFLGYDYVVVSATARDRYLGLAESFPRQEAFYRDLERYCELVRHFPASAERRGPDVWIYRVGPGARRILEERGPVSRGFAADLEDVRPSDLLMFLAYTAGVARQRGDWPSVALYLATILDVTPQEYRHPEQILLLADAKYRAGDLIGAGRLCDELLVALPNHPRVLALRAAIERAARSPGD